MNNTTGPPALVGRIESRAKLPQDSHGFQVLGAFIWTDLPLDLQVIPTTFKRVEIFKSVSVITVGLN